MFTRKKIALAYAFVAAAALLMCHARPAWSQAAASSYVAVDLGGGLQSSATGLNNRGQVVVWIHGDQQPSVWEPAIGLRAITMPGTGSAGLINASGQMAGSATIPYPSQQYGDPDYAQRAFLWDGLDTFAELGTLAPDTDSVATDLNDAGQVVGYVFTSHSSGFQPSAFLYSQGVMQPIPGVDVAYGINTLGQVAGEGGGRAVVRDPAGEIRVLGAEGAWSTALEINDGGWTAGGSTTGETDPATGNAIYRAVVWDPAGAAQQPGTVDGLPQSYATSINKHGVVVGHCDNYNWDSQVPFIWDQANGIRKLEDLVPLPAGWHLMSAEDINDNGEIVGMAIEGTFPQFEWHAVLMRPVTTATPAGEDVTTTPPIEDALGNPVDAGYSASITFPDVDAAGDTTVTVFSTEPALPAYYGLANQAAYFDIDTTAAPAEGTEITITIHYDDTGMTEEQEQNLRLLHFVDGVPVPAEGITVLPVNTVDNIICGRTPSLSPFAIVVSDRAAPVTTAEAAPGARP